MHIIVKIRKEKVHCYLIVSGTMTELTKSIPTFSSTDFVLISILEQQKIYQIWSTVFLVTTAITERSYRPQRWRSNGSLRQTRLVSQCPIPTHTHPNTPIHTPIDQSWQGCYLVKLSSLHVEVVKSSRCTRHEDSFKLNPTNLEVCDLFLCVILLVGEGRLHSVDLPLRFQTLPVAFLLNLQKSRFQVSEHRQVCSLNLELFPFFLLFPQTNTLSLDRVIRWGQDSIHSLPQKKNVYCVCTWFTGCILKKKHWYRKLLA